MIDEQHPIPQQISSYQFRLVGDMTLKQFFQVAAGSIIALVLYSTALPSYIKWPLILISFLSGVAFAFLPFQDRPLSVWLVSFFKSIYEPTLYIWKQQQQQREFFAPENILPPVQVPSQPQTALPQLPPEPASPPPVTETVTTPVSEPTGLPPIKETSYDRYQEILPTPAYMSAQTTSSELESATKSGPTDLQIPQTQAVEVEKSEKPAVLPSAVSTQTQPQAASDTSYLAPAASQQITTSKPAQFSPEATPPIPPTIPNVVVGQVLTSDGKIVENAILEIKDSEGRAVRALKSNKLGHFMIVTPLSDGGYQITAEKDGFNFEPSSFQADGQIIQPILVQGQSTEHGGEVFVNN